MTKRPAPRLKCEPPRGLRPSLENRTIAELQVDASYQRSIENGESQSLIRRIAMFWDWALFQPLVVARRDDGTFWIVDGQHRLAAARLRRDIYDLPCVVTTFASTGDEAAAFVALNQQRKRLSRMDLFKAALAAVDEAAVEIMGLIEAAGLSLSPHSNWTAWKPGMISNIGGIVTAHRRFGAQAAGDALRVLAHGFAGQVLRYGGTIFGGLAPILGGGVVDPDDGNTLAADRELLIAVLQGADQAEWMKEITRERTNASWPVAAATVIGAAYLEALAEADA